MSDNEKIQNLKEIEYITNFNFVGECIIELYKKNPESDTIKKMKSAWTEIGFYIHGLHQDQKWYNHSMSEYRADKLRAIERARRAEKKLENINMIK